MSLISVCGHEFLIKNASLCVSRSVVPSKKCFECNTILPVEELVDRLLESFKFPKETIKFIVDVYKCRVYLFIDDGVYLWVLTERGMMRRYREFKLIQHPQAYIKDGFIYSLSALGKSLSQTITQDEYEYVPPEKPFSLLNHDGLSISMNTVESLIKEVIKERFSITKKDIKIKVFYDLYNRTLDSIEDFVIKGGTKVLLIYDSSVHELIYGFS